MNDPDLLTKCDKCGRRSLMRVGATCGIPQPNTSLCDGTFEAPKNRENDDRIRVTAAGAPVEFKIQFGTDSSNPFPPPKVVLSDRAKQAASDAYDDCDKGPRKSMHYAVEAAAGIIVADNLTEIQIGIDSAIGLFEMIGYRGNAKILRSVADMIDEYIVALDPDRPVSDE